MIKVKPLEAKFLKDADTFSKMDPYIILHFGQQKFQTKPHEKGGVNPKWHEEFELDVSKTEEMELKIEAWDRDPISDDALGRSKIWIKKWMQNENSLSMQNIDLELEGETTGQLRLQYRYVSNVVPQKEVEFIID